MGRQLGRAAIVVVVGAITTGCATSPSPPPTKDINESIVGDPGGLAPSRLAILEGANRVRVGDSQEAIELAFPTPAGAFPFKELPSQFNGSYRAKGFETSTTGFGAIYYENRLAAGLYRLENVTAGEVESLARIYVDAFGEPSHTLPKGSIQYWFWEAEDQRLMLCSVPDRQNQLRYDVTIALGSDVVMNALRMSYPHAKEDQSIGESNRSK